MDYGKLLQKAFGGSDWQLLNQNYPAFYGANRGLIKINDPYDFRLIDPATGQPGDERPIGALQSGGQTSGQFDYKPKYDLGEGIIPQLDFLPKAMPGYTMPSEEDLQAAAPFPAYQASGYAMPDQSQAQGQSIASTRARPADAPVKDNSIPMGLLAAGLGVLANNTGHYGAAGPAIGKGGLVGLQAYGQERDRIAQQSQLANSNRFRDQQLASNERLREAQAKRFEEMNRREDLKWNRSENARKAYGLLSTQAQGLLAERGEKFDPNKPDHMRLLGALSMQNPDLGTTVAKEYFDAAEGIEKGIGRPKVGFKERNFRMPNGMIQRQESYQDGAEGSWKNVGSPYDPSKDRGSLSVTLGDNKVIAQENQLRDDRQKELEIPNKAIQISNAFDGAVKTNTSQGWKAAGTMLQHMLEPGNQALLNEVRRLEGGGDLLDRTIGGITQFIAGTPSLEQQAAMKQLVAALRTVVKRQKTQINKKYTGLSTRMKERNPEFNPQNVVPPEEEEFNPDDIIEGR